MIVEQRTYSLKIGAAPKYLALYEAEGLPVQRAILGRMVGYFSSDIGALHQIVHMWAYTGYAEREERRAILNADPRWQAYLPKIREFQISQENRILIPASFSPWATDDPTLDMAK